MTLSEPAMPDVRPPTPHGPTEAIALDICERFSKGELLTEFLGTAPYPTTAAWYQWVSTHDWIRDLWAAAKIVAADTFAAEALLVARNCASANPRDPAAARLAHQALAWYASKLDAARWGDHRDVGNGVTVTINTNLGDIQGNATNNVIESTAYEVIALPMHGSDLIDPPADGPTWVGGEPPLSESHHPAHARGVTHKIRAKSRKSQKPYLAKKRD